MKAYEIVTATLAVLFIIVVLFWQFSRWSDCNDRNGAYVQSTFGYTCVERVK